MVNSIVQTDSRLWEVWCIAHPDLRMHVSECGSFGSEGEACRVAGLVRLWLEFGVFGPELWAAVPDENDRHGLFALPDVIRSLGYDPVRVLVTELPDTEVATLYAGDLTEGEWGDIGDTDVPEVLERRYQRMSAKTDVIPSVAQYRVTKADPR